MLEAHSVESAYTGAADDEVALTFEQRQKSRYRTRMCSGRELGWFLARGIVLADGDGLRCSDGSLVRVSAAAETVSEVHAATHLDLARAAYHLGNRHVALQLMPDRLLYLYDEVLDQMVRGLGLQVQTRQLPFNPERGAYHSAHLHPEDTHAAAHAAGKPHSHD